MILGPQRESNLVNPNPRAQDRHRLGLGMQMPALYRRSQDPAVDRSQRPGFDPSIAHPNPMLMFFSWTAGNLDRYAYVDAFQELCTRPGHHIALHQEAVSMKISNTCASLGIAESSTGDRHLSAHAGGTGIKIIRPLFELGKQM